MQDENIKGWQKGLFGKEVQNSALGTLKDKLKRNPNVIVIDRFFPSTKLCPICGTVKDDITLKDRTYVCQKCGYREDRDVKSAKTILLAGLGKNNLLLCGTHEYSSGESVRLCCQKATEQTRKAI